MKTRTMIEYGLVVLVILILGAFAGWYFFLNTRSRSTIALDAARGYETSNADTRNSSASAPSLLSRMLGAITGGGTGVSLPSPASFGESGINDSFRTGSSADASSTPQTKRAPRLWHVETKPVAGMDFVKTAEGERLRYVERSTGYVYEADAETSLVTRVENTLAPKTYEAIVTPNRRVVRRSLDDAGRILTSIGALATSSKSTATTSAQTPPVTLVQDISHVVVGPRDELFYLVNDASGVGGFRSEWNGAKPKRVFSSSITNWRPTWLSDGRIILSQAAADGVPGYAYELATNGTLRSIVRAAPGLTVLPRTSGALLYGESGEGILALFVRVSPTATSVRLSIKTIADKCAWSSGKDLIAYCGVPQGLVARNFLNDWYRGVAHSTDTLWRIDASAGSAEILYAPGTGVSLDVENLAVGSIGNYLAFRNAVDQSVWILRINE